MGDELTVLESSGLDVGVNTDFDGDARPGRTGLLNVGGIRPDLGADEFDGSIYAALPIKLVAFNGRTNGNANFLYWNTAAEDNGDLFILERSINGRDFAFVHSFPAKGKPSTYEFTDYEAPAGTNFYRLQEKNIDGVTNYSNILKLFIKNASDLILSAYPNPAMEQVTIKVRGSIPADATIEIYNSKGSLINTLSNITGETKVDLRAYARGVYFIKYNGREQVQTVRVNKQ
jgi:hypothetical protein